MISEITKHINVTNASYRKLGAGDAKNTDLFLDNEHYELFKDCGEKITVRFSKTNLSQAILFISSILPKKYDHSAIHKIVEYSKEFVFDQLSFLDSLFIVDNESVETITQLWNVRKDTTKKNGKTDKRFYFNGLIQNINYKDHNGNLQNGNFSIRNYLIGGYSDLHIKKAEDGVFDIIITNTQQPYFDSKNEEIQNEEELLISKNNTTQFIKYVTNLETEHGFGRNRIIFGAPGTGKSFKLNNELKELLGDNNEKDYERVTFHPDYSYANFVGTYKPVMKQQEVLDQNTKSVIDILNDSKKTTQEKYDSLFDTFSDKKSRVLPILVGIYTREKFIQKTKDLAPIDNCYEGMQGIALSKYVNLINNTNLQGDISYEYIPGPFMRMYVKALKNAQTENPRPFLLIIEEINRANVAAVFGDIFQLLDRDYNNVSEYPIQASEDVKKYLAKEFDRDPEDFAQIRIPNNLFIWATMNSADQGVFPMDTAFKRRWDFTYLGIDENTGQIADKFVMINGKKVYWNGLRMTINDYLAKIGINEDKQLGPYFIKQDILDKKNEFCEVFKHKIIMYLFEDAAKQKRSLIFSGVNKENLRYSKICEEFDKKGIEIFCQSIIDTYDLYDYPKDSNDK